MSTEPSIDRPFVFNPLDPAFVADPYPTYTILRTKTPVYAWPQGHCFLLSKFDDVAAALRDPRLSTNAAHWEFAKPPLPDAEKTELDRLTGRSLLMQNGQDHARLRRLVSPPFSPRRVEELRDSVQSIVDAAVAPHLEKDTINVAEIAAFIPMRVISAVLGIPQEFDPSFRRFGTSIIEAFDPLRTPEELARILEPIPAGFALIRRIIEDRRRALGDDLLSNLIRAEEAGDHLSSDELCALVAGMIVGGAETTVHLIGFCMKNLLNHPDALAEIKADPSLLRGAIEEVMRFDSFVKMDIARYALTDVEIRGVTIPKGKMIIPLTASAGRDPDMFVNADTFDIHRGVVDHLTFGSGPHLCLGASLARLEAEVTVNTLLRRFPSMRLAAAPEYGQNPYLRTLTSLRIDVRPS